MSYVDGAYHDESDADDEGAHSPSLIPEYESSSSPTESDPPSTEQTPTTFAHSTAQAISPRGLITEWDAHQVADYVASLGLEGYRDKILEHGIDGDTLVQLKQSHLKEMNIASMGHRLTILRGVYEVKLKQNITIEEDDYVPASADSNMPDTHATQDDVVRIIHQIKLRDDRIKELEDDLRSMREELWRMQDEQRKLRDDTLPVIRQLKDRTQPLPMPESYESQMTPSSPHPSISNQHMDIKTGSGISRRLSTARNNILNTFSKPQNIPSPRIPEEHGLDPSAAAVAASNHLTSSFNSDSRGSPQVSNQPSPTSPPPQSIRGGREGPRPQTGRRDDSYPNYERATPTNNGPGERVTSTINSSSRNITRTNTNQSNVSTQNSSSANTPTTTTSQQTLPERDRNPSRERETSTSADDPNGFMKSFRVSMEEPCYKVLPVALKKYHIQDDWKEYSLYIVHGDQERCLGYDEKPLILFKQLANEGKKPMFMLRKHATNPGGFVHTRGQGASEVGSATDGGQTITGNDTQTPRTASLASSHMNIPGNMQSRVQSYASSMQLPGGVL